MFDKALGDTHLRTWRENHCLVMPSMLQGEALRNLQSWAHTLSEWPEQPGQWMKYFETGDTGVRQLCRIENFIPYHKGFSDLLAGSETLRLVSQLMGEPAVIFKEKINYKLPGAAGFAAHQDAPAFGTFGHRYHITMMVAIDDSTLENGCLEFSEPVDQETILPQAPDQTVALDAALGLSWTPVKLRAGDVVFFDSYIPHRSAKNQSQTARRAIFATYNRAVAGAVRERYFAEKRVSFPPECEREAGVDYNTANSPFNVGNPIR